MTFDVATKMTFDFAKKTTFDVAKKMTFGIADSSARTQAAEDAGFFFSSLLLSRVE